jgi:hypothetical protein
MELTDEQKQTVSQWVSEGQSLSDIQSGIQSSFGISMTYMDVRFLVLDLGVDVQDKPEPSPPPEAVTALPPPMPGADPAPAGAPLGGVQVEIDRVTKPGSVVSGQATFSDGVTATWFVDQLGRLALDPGTPDYKPSPEDIQAFQEQLRSELAKRGF